MKRMKRRIIEERTLRVRRKYVIADRLANYILLIFCINWVYGLLFNIPYLCYGCLVTWICGYMILPHFFMRESTYRGHTIVEHSKS